MRLPSGWVETTLGAIRHDHSDTVDPAKTPQNAFELYSVPAHETGKPELLAGGRIRSTKQTVAPGTVLVCKINPRINRVWVVLPPGSAAVQIASTEWIPFPPSSAVSAHFLANYLRQDAFRNYLAQNASGVGGSLMRVRRAVLDPYPLVLAPVPEQHRIVAAIESYVTRLDYAVASLERVERNLKRYRASILSAAVEGRLVPTEAALARAEGRGYEPASVLLERILAERRKRWEQAERRGKYQEPVAPITKDLPELPEGWCWATWAQVGSSQNGRAFPSNEYDTEGVRLLRPGNLHVSGRVEWTEKNTRCMPTNWVDEFPSFLVGGDELVMNLTAQSLKDEFLGRICITSPDERCLLNQRIAKLVPTLVRPRFLLWLFKSSIFRRFVDGLNTGSLIQHMFTSQLAEFVLPLPPLAEQERIVLAVERLLSTAEVLERDGGRSGDRVTKLRQSILKWAFEGKLVDQDPEDEPALVLLEPIRTENAAASTTTFKKSRKRRSR
jgi:type I restriction enzyme S subunit